MAMAGLSHNTEFPTMTPSLKREFRLCKSHFLCSWHLGLRDGNDFQQIHMLCSSSGEPWNLRYLFAIFQSTHIFFFWFGLLKMPPVFFSERKSESQPDFSLASGPRLFTWRKKLQCLWCSQSALADTAPVWRTPRPERTLSHTIIVAHLHSSFYPER